MHSAKLIWVTPDAEALIGKIARVSNPNNEDNPIHSIKSGFGRIKPILYGKIKTEN